MWPFKRRKHVLVVSGKISEEAMAKFKESWKQQIVDMPDGWQTPVITPMFAQIIPARPWLPRILFSLQVLWSIVPYTFFSVLASFVSPFSLPKAAEYEKRSNGVIDTVMRQRLAMWQRTGQLCWVNVKTAMTTASEMLADSVDSTYARVQIPDKHREEFLALTMHGVYSVEAIEYAVREGFFDKKTVADIVSDAATHDRYDCPCDHPLGTRGVCGGCNCADAP